MLHLELMKHRIKMNADSTGRLRPSLDRFTREEVVEKFKTKIVKVDRGHATPCWEWSGSRNEQGYGEVWFDGKNRRAHRFSFEVAFGEIIEGLCVCHKCDNPPCVNPDHLFLGTKKDNAQDASRKKRLKPQRGALHKKAKLTLEDVKYIRSHHVPNVVGYKRIAKKFGVSESLIYRIVKRKNWAHVN